MNQLSVVIDSHPQRPMMPTEDSSVFVQWDDPLGMHWLRLEPPCNVQVPERSQSSMPFVSVQDSAVFAWSADLPAFRWHHHPVPYDAISVAGKPPIIECMIVEEQDWAESWLIGQSWTGSALTRLCVSLDCLTDTQMLIATLEADYSFADREAVAYHLQAEPDLLPALQQAADEIGARFGRHRLVLDVFSDPEEDLPQSLVVRIETELPPAEAVQQRARFHEQWWTPYSMQHGRKSIIFSLGPLR